MPLSSGSLFANRFEIERMAGAGGMGTVYRAHDRFSGGLVALKLMHDSLAARPEAERFEREAQLLAELHCPGIVGYIAHGQTPEGQRYLAMEWLDGEDLSARLQRGPLSISESVTLLQQVAESLAVAHGRGIIHRDLKPCNLFIPGGRIEQVKLLDFGIARRTSRSTLVTGTGMVVGTPEYMAPEQARSDRDLRPAVDIFALGCVLYECLTGQPPFVANHIAAVLVRILFEDPPPVRNRRPTVPDSLAGVLGRMLAKDPGQRFADATSLLGALANLPLHGEQEDAALRKSELAAAPLSNHELQLVGVIVLQESPPASLDQTVAQQPDAHERETFHRLVQAGARFGARAWLLADNTVLVMLTQAASATDLAAQTARCALAMAVLWPGARIALSTGRGLAENHLAIGEAFERAIGLLRGLPAAAARLGLPEGRTNSEVAIWMSESSVGLLDGRFAIDRVCGQPVLRCERAVADESRQLLGKPTPCVGRDKELLTLEASFGDCVDCPRASGVLITAAPGIGKSRLRHEFLRRLAARSERVTVLLGSGTPLTAGSPYSCLRQALRRGFGVLDDATSAVQRAQLLAQLGTTLSPAAVRRVLPFLGELCGIPHAEEEYPALRPARQDPKVMSGQVTQAFTEWLSAACAVTPHLLVLEDLHWGDPLTLQLVGAALQACADVPLMVLAVARPELHDQYPGWWRHRGITELSLPPLGKRACERLAQQILGQVLGSEVDAETVDRIVEQSAGNALFLEELVRAVAEGNGDRLPESVLAMLQARIGRLPSQERRILRAASVFGGSFWRGGVRMVTGGHDEDSAIDAAFQRLTEEGIIQPSTGSRFQKEPEYHFRHALVREAAYSLLTDSDRMAAHRLAGLFLQRKSAVQATAVAEPGPGEAPTMRDENLFDIVRHLNLAAPLLIELEQRFDLAHTNLQAALRAKAAAAYQAAAGYLRVGVSLLPDNPWERVHDLAFALHRELAQCEFLCGHLDTADALFAALFKQAPAHHEQVEIQCLRTDLHTTTGRLDEALREALLGLSLCGIVIPESEAARQQMVQAEHDAVTRNLGQRRIADLGDAPTQTDFAHDSEQKALLALYMPAYFLSPTIFAIAILKMVNRALVHGNSEQTSSGYMSYAVLLAGNLGRYEEAVEFGRTALKLNERFRCVALNCRLLCMFGSVVAHYRLPLRETIAALELALMQGPESGDLIYHGYAALFIPMQTYATGRPLSEISELVERSLALVLRTQEQVAPLALQCYAQVVRALGGQTGALDSLNDAAFDEAQYLSMVQAQKMGAVECLYYVRKAQLAYFAGRFAAAYDFAAAAEPLLPSSAGCYHTTEIPFWRTLALLAQRPDAGPGSGAEDALARDLHALAAYGDNAPVNYVHKLRLVQAEKARADGHAEHAASLYQEALQLAESGGFIPEAALTHELWLRFLHARGDTASARMHLHSASQLYAQWGATAKVAQLESLDLG